MNELIFFMQIFILVGCGLGALRLGKMALVVFVCVQALIANLFVLKQIYLFGLHVTASDAFAIGSLLGLNLIQEYYSKEEAQQTAWTCFFFMLFFAIISQLHLLYVPSASDHTQEAFQTILTHSPRLLIASLTTFFIVQQVDIRFFVFLKTKLPATSFAVRAGISLVLLELLDTLLFSFLGLYGLVASLSEIIVLSFIIKIIVVGSCTTLLRFAKT